jgi:hypothetical protein
MTRRTIPDCSGGRRWVRIDLCPRTVKVCLGARHSRHCTAGRVDPTLSRAGRNADSARGDVFRPGGCITASVEDFAQRSSVHTTGCANGDDPGPGLRAVPFTRECDVHSLADNLKDDASARLLGDVDHAFASIDAGRQPACGFSQRFHRQGRLRFVAPRPEDLRVIASMPAVIVMPALGVITVGSMAKLRWRCGVESGGIKPADRQQDLQRHVTLGRLDEPIAMEPVVEPCLDPLDLFRGDQIELVEDEHVGESRRRRLSRRFPEALRWPVHYHGPKELIRR